MSEPELVDISEFVPEADYKPHREPGYAAYCIDRHRARRMITKATRRLKHALVAQADIGERQHRLEAKFHANGQLGPVQDKSGVTEAEKVVNGLRRVISTLRMKLA